MSETQDDSQQICRNCLRPKVEHEEVTKPYSARLHGDVTDEELPPLIEWTCPGLTYAKFSQDYSYWTDDGHTVHVQYHYGNLSLVVTCPGKPQCKAYYGCDCEGTNDDCKLCHGTGRDETHDGCWLEAGEFDDFEEMCPVKVPFDLKRPVRILWVGGEEPEWRPADINEGA